MRNINDEDDIRKTFEPRPNTNKDYVIDYVMGSQRNVLYNLANAIHAIEHDEVLIDLFHFNLTTNREMLKMHKKIIAVTDRIRNECWEYLQRYCGLRAIKQTDVDHAIHTVARRNPYDPLIDGLNSLVWDGIPRADDWLIVCFGAEDNAYNREIGLRMLLAMVKRAKEPGCKCDYMPVLEGPQGIGKSSAVRILGGDFYSENLPPLDANGGKEACIHVLGYWIIEVAEMDVMTRKHVEASHLKSFISRTHERFRGINARREEQTPRRCFFIGTTNRKQYLRDETGARRIWPIECTKVDLIWLKANRDQLLAEALQRLRDGEEIWPSQEFEIRHVVKEQAKRQEFDELFNLIKDWLASFVSPPAEITGAQVWRAIKQDDKAIPNQIEATRIGSVLRQLGFERRDNSIGKKVWRKV